VSDLLVLWDLDGTLLNAGGVGAELYTLVFGQLFGRSLDALAPMAGRTDRAIILETLELAGIAEPRRYVDPFIAGLTESAPSVREAIARRGRALPGAMAALAALAARSSGRGGGASPGRGGGASPGRGGGASPGRGGGASGLDGRVHQSVLTGNIRPVAEVKLAALGLHDLLDLCIGAYGDDHEVRTELVSVARRRAAARYGGSVPGADFGGVSTVVVGDTPLDISAALTAGARAVGVATGPFTAAELRAAGAHAVLPDLTDTSLVLSALLPELRRVRGCREAVRRAGPERATPPPLSQRLRYLRRRRAGVPRDLVPVVPQRRAAVGDGIVVAAPVPAALVFGVCLLAVELDDQPVVRVVAVAEAAAAVRLGERDLSPGGWQPVRALNVPVVTELQQRVRAARRRGNDLVELPPPAELPASAQRPAQRALGGEPPPERTGHPGDHVVERLGRVHEVDDRLLDQRVRRHPARKPRPGVDMARPVDNHALDRPDAPANWNRYVNQRGPAFSEAVQLGSCLMTQLRPFACVQYRRP
jgi:phosphoglycolate phosphatase-like HAD superfamily hydrolase